MMALRLFVTSLALLILPVVPCPAVADCVAPLAACTMECDQTTKPENPDRPLCARRCISSYQRCERIEQVRSSTGGPVLNQGTATKKANP